jgi:hypothetical protein
MPRGRPMRPWAVKKGNSTAGDDGLNPTPSARRRMNVVPKALFLGVPWNDASRSPHPATRTLAPRPPKRCPAPVTRGRAR